VGSRGGVGQEEQSRGSPRRSGDGGAAGSGRRGDVPVGGRLQRGGGVLGVDLRLAVKAGKVAAGVTSERDEKHGARGGGIQPAAGGITLLKGAGVTRAEWGSGASGDAWGERVGAQARGTVQRRSVGGSSPAAPRAGGGVAVLQRRDARGADACD
jgi:hypothetical protein